MTLEDFFVRAGVVREENYAAPPQPPPVGMFQNNGTNFAAIPAVPVASYQNGVGEAQCYGVGMKRGDGYSSQPPPQSPPLGGYGGRFGSSGFFFGYLVNGICEEYVYNRLTFSEREAINKVNNQAVKASVESETLKMQKLMKQYILFLSKMGKQADKVWIEMRVIEKGILQLIKKTQNRKANHGSCS